MVYFVISTILSSFGRSPADYQDKLRCVLDRLKQAGVQLNNAKCHFSQTEISFLGHIINKNGVFPDKTKQLNLEQFPPPSDEKELRSFPRHGVIYRSKICEKTSRPAPFLGVQLDASCKQSVQRCQTSNYNCPIPFFFR